MLYIKNMFRKIRIPCLFRFTITTGKMKKKSKIVFLAKKDENVSSFLTAYIWVLIVDDHLQKNIIIEQKT